MTIWRILLVSLAVAFPLGCAGAAAAVAADEPAAKAEAGHDSAHGADHGEGEHGDAEHGDAGDGHAGDGHAGDGHDAAHGAHGDPKPLTVDPDLMIWTAVVFGVLLLVLSKFAWRPILDALDSREQRIADDLAAAEARHQEAKMLLASYEERLAGAAGEVRTMLDEARRDAEHTKTEIVAEAKAAAQAEHDRAIREVHSATDGALKELAERSANMAVELAGKIVEEKLNPEDHARLVHEAVSRFPSQN